MPVPSLMKRLSIKALLRNNSSSTDNRETHERPKSDVATPSMAENDSPIVTPSSSTCTPNEHTTLSQTRKPLNVVGGALAYKRERMPDDNVDLYGLADAAAMASRNPQRSKAVEVLEKAEDMVLATQSDQPNSATILTTIKIAMDVTGRTEAIEQGVSSFVEGSALLMSVLDDVAKCILLLEVMAVMAFKCVYMLEMKRRENDRKILALHLEMRDMIAVLVQLKEIKDPKAIGPDGSTIEGRMQGIAQKAAHDIKECANACDTYLKKKLIVKVLKGPIWETRLASYGGLFTKHRSEFEFALTIHTAVGVETANETLGDVQQMTAAIDAKVNMMMKMFQSLTSPEEAKLSKLVEKNGGSEAVQDDDKLLKELSNLQSTDGVSSQVGASQISRRTGGKAYSFEDLQDDLHADPDVAIEKNMTIFLRKFEIQQRRLLDEMTAVVKREGNRVIDTLTSGPHDRILDLDVHNLWKEMGWRGSVKTRYFVMALRDYFHEKWRYEVKKAESANTSTQNVADNPDSDDWALAYLHVQRLQPVSESVDDDASGFVTVAEVNKFTNSRPINWSLLHWIAFWAIGWHQSLADYAKKIQEMFAKMFAILPHILPANQAAVNKYLVQIYKDVTTIQASVNPCYINEALQAKFADYLDSEEARLRKNLETVHYDIDEMDTLALITGPGRIGKYAHCLLYLLLQRHFEIFRICQSHVIHQDELWDAAGTIGYIVKAYKERFGLLQTVFKQQRVDLKQHFATFANGMFQYHYDPAGLWAPEIVKNREFPEYTYDDNMESKDINIDDILNYQADQRELDPEAYDATFQGDPTTYSATTLTPLLGPWNGFMYRKIVPTFPSRGMISVTLCPSSLKDQWFEGSSRSNLGDFTVSGKCSPGETEVTINISMKREFVEHHPTQYWEGQMDVDTETIMGTWGFDPDPTIHHGTFILKRTAPEDLCFRPAPVTFETDKVLSLWKFALTAIEARVRRQTWSWSYFKERRDNRKRFIELYIRNGHFGCPLNSDEIWEFRRVRQTLTSADSRYYHSLANYRVRRTIDHGVRCDHCHGSIGGARIICLVCQAKETWHTLDLCEAPDCAASSAECHHLHKPHVPSHDVVKVRCVVHIRQFGKLSRDAKEAIERAKTVFGRDETIDAEEEAYDIDYPSQVVEPTPKSLSTSVEQRCAACNDTITRPCWYCVQCNDDIFICAKCDARGGVEFGDHQAKHTLVKCQQTGPEEDDESSSDNRLSKLEDKFATMDNRLRRLDSKVDDRLRKVEELLHSVLGKLEDGNA